MAAAGPPPLPPCRGRLDAGRPRKAGSLMEAAAPAKGPVERLLSPIADVRPGETASVLLILVPAYGAFASRVNRVQLVTWMPVFFASHIAIFALLVGAHVRVGVPYFLWVGIFNVMVIAQFWAFANDLYSPDQGKRLFQLI